MNRSIVLAALLAAALGLTVRAGLLARPDEKHEHHAMNSCAKECARCMMECESCAKHCAMMLAKGEKKHLETLGTCADCGDFCALAAKVVSRKGPLANTTCEGCAKACDVCGKACEKFPDDEHMKRCAKACRDCAKACREMLEHAGHREARTEKK